MTIQQKRIMYGNSKEEDERTEVLEVLDEAEKCDGSCSAPFSKKASKKKTLFLLSYLNFFKTQVQ